MAELTVCMAVHNGAQYVSEQVASILPQISMGDELIVCDDNSTDDSVSIVSRFNDSRIRVIPTSKPGVVGTFESALSEARGSYIFLSDQDDVWSPNKVQVMKTHLRDIEMVVSDCVVVDERLNVLQPSFHQFSNAGRGVVKNLIRNTYMGCCMAFHRKVLERALPIPHGVAMHDAWLGIVADLFFRVAFISDTLVQYRRHPGNFTALNTHERKPIIEPISQRLRLAHNILRLTLAGTKSGQ